MSSSFSPFTLKCATPYYADHGLFIINGGVPRQWEFNGWEKESVSWKKGCYIHGGLSGPGLFVYKGRDASAFLQSFFVNNFSKFKVGTVKHGIMCTETGLVAGHGALQKISEEEFRVFVSGPWPRYMFHTKSGFDVEEVVHDNYLFQVAGPTSLKTLEAATGEDLSDIAFLRYRNSKIAGKPVEIMRIGMAGTLAYEVHGPIADGPDVYDAIFQAGQPYDIERLGWRSYFVNHVEAGFGQQSWTFLAASLSDPGFRKYVDTIKPVRWTEPRFSGSVDPSDMRARLRTPWELGWENSVRFDHEFVGRAALEKEHADPKRKPVTLIWNADDVIDIYASLFRQGPNYTPIELPASPNHRAVLAHADHILKNDKPVGVSSGTIYSYHFRTVMSHGALDIAQAEIGNEVVVQWGEHGGPLKDVRARVERFPYFNEGR